MTDQKPKFNPVKIPIFMMIGAIAIMFTDLVILDGKKNIQQFDFERFASSASNWFDNDELISVSGLRQQHNLYLNEGINMPSEFVMASSRPEPLMSLPPKPKKTSENLPPADDLLTLEDILEQERNEELASIQPASGIIGADGENYDLSYLLEEDNDRSEEPYAEIVEERDVNDIIADLGFGKTIEEKPEASPVQATLIQESPKAEAISYSYKEPKSGGKIAIIIDDMGLSLRSRLVEILPAPLTLAYLPYADNLSEKTKRAKKNGHELMVHMPMEPMNNHQDGGPRVLSTKQSDEQLRDTLNWGLSQFDGFVGVNNHMGSRLTQDRHAMDVVMEELKKRDVYFVDSKTIGSSVAAEMAREHGLYYAERDVFLDHKITPEFIRDALKKVEQTARRQGYAVAIGHPHQETIDALKEWLPTVESKGYTLVPASAILKQPVVDDRVAATQ